MSKHTITDAIRMVGHLLEHNGIVGPFYADKNGNPTDLDDPQTCRYCMSGAFEAVAKALGLADLDPFGFNLSAPVEEHFGDTSRVRIWEGRGQEYSTPAERLAIARKLQNWGEP